MSLSLPTPASVLIVDDSAFARRALRLGLEGSGAFLVIAEASTGEEAVRLAQELRPRLVTMDLELPGISGLEAIERIMSECPTRIVVLTANACFGGTDASFEALSRGALDLLPKPAVWNEHSDELHSFVATLARLATVPVVPHFGRRIARRRAERLTTAAVPSEPTRGEAAARGPIVAVGASSGGPSALRSLLAELPRDFALPVIVVQHLSESFSAGFVAWLASECRVQVKEALPGALLSPATVYVATRGAHVGVGADDRIIAIDESPRRDHRPAVDVLFESVARTCAARGIGVLLSGMGDDGAAGLLAIRRAGGVTLAQDEASCVVFGMPKAAIERGAAAHVLGPKAIAEFLTAVAYDRRA